MKLTIQFNVFEDQNQASADIEKGTASSGTLSHERVFSISGQELTLDDGLNATLDYLRNTYLWRST